MYFKNLIRVRKRRGNLYFHILGVPWPLLILQRQTEKQEVNRIKYHIIGGFLTKTVDTGWLEFREILGGKHTLALINNFIPALPWYIYKHTQAKIHLIVMHHFDKFINQQHSPR